MINTIKNIKKNKPYILFMCIIVFFLYAAYKYYFNYSYLIKDPTKIKNIIKSYGKFGSIVFIFLQIIQVVIFFIPGEIMEIAGGYVFGISEGVFLSLSGIIIGSIISYFIAKLFGKPLVDIIVSKKKFEKSRKFFKAENFNLVIFLVYLIPGAPKDILGFIAGVSDVKFKNFIVYSNLGRIPGIIVSTYFGYKIGNGNIKTLLIILIIMIFIFILAVIKGEKFLNYIIKKY